MEFLTILSLVLGIGGTAAAIVFGYKAYARNEKTDNTETGKNNGAVLTELGYIKSGIDDIKHKQERQDDQHIEVINRISAVEASAKQAHKRIDDVNEHIDRMHGVK